MDITYPNGPESVPGDLTAPSRSYRRQAWVATGGLLLFVGAYFALTGWFGWTAWRLWAGLPHASGDSVILGHLLGGAGAAFLAVFMLKALVFIKRGEAVEDLQITAQDQPTLFAFLYRLADEAGAPRPHRVYLSARVNAGVFYDLSLANLVISSKKNLEIGLGLVNVLNLGEFKAVLAHEFGHFAQRTMAVGRWVYIAQQIAGHIVARRDALDAFLAQLSRIDIRIAWIGWVLRLIIWSIRSLVDLLFRIVVLAQRALGREMEFQADLVAVSTTGSDALIHALHKLAAADQSWGRAVDFANSEIVQGHGVRDLFAVQTRIIDRVRSVLNDAAYGVAPPIPATQPETHRLFKATLAAPPKMWATHPTNSDREINAKRTYVAASIDERSAWTLFNDPTSLCEQVTARLTRKAECKPAPLEETLARVDAQYARTYLNSSYRGAYLARSIVRHARSADELFGAPLPREQLIAGFAALYPESLTAELERLRSLNEEKQTLTALRSGLLTAPGGVIRHRGNEVSRKALPQIIESLKAELEACERIVREHDQKCRTVYLSAANELGEGWPDYLKGLLQVLHYADHIEANLLDAHAVLANTVAVVTAGRKVTDSGRTRVLNAAVTTYATLRAIHDAADKVVLDRTLLNRLKATSWRGFFEALRLSSPDRSNLAQWLNSIDSWVRSAANALGALRLATLDQLLAAETQIDGFIRKSLKPGQAPPRSQVPAQYELLLPGAERPRTTLDSWDRFQTGSGFFPAALRMLAAAAIVGAVLFIGSSASQPTVHIFNGVGQPVVVRIGSQSVTVPPFQHREVGGGNSDHVHVVTTTADADLIEEFDATVAGSGSQEIYNVAGAGVLVSWEAVYGAGTPRTPTMLGDPRWSQSSAQVVFEQPPATAPTRYGAARKEVLSGFAGEYPGRVLQIANDPTTVNNVLAAHLRWDGPRTHFMDIWVSAASRLPQFKELIQARVKEHPTEVYNMRLEQDYAGASHAEVCARHRQMAAAAPTNPDLQYVATRCMEDGEEQQQAFLDLHSRYPKNGWLDLAAAYTFTERGQWREALDLYDRGRYLLPVMSESTTIAVARLRRMVEGNANAELRPLIDQSPTLASLTVADVTDSHEHPENIVPAYIMLAQGRLGEALRVATGPPDDRARLLRMVAASDGASPLTIQQALKLSPDEGLDRYTVISTLALVARTGGDTAPYVQRAATLLGEQSDRILKAFELVRRRAGRAEVDEALRGLNMELRAEVYVAAAVLHGKQCPAEWRQVAQRMLFSIERPFLD